MNYLLDLWTGIGYVFTVLWMLWAWGCWEGVRRGVITWTAERERALLALTLFSGAFVPMSVLLLAVAPNLPHAWDLATGAPSTYWFGRAWWKLHRDGPKNGRRRRRVKAAVKRLGNRLVVVPQPVPGMSQALTR